MKLDRLPHDPSALLDFFQEGLEALGAVCERSWHDRLQLVAEGRAAQLWRSDGALLETELHFPPADTSGPRQADLEVFPGCPLTFRLAEAFRPRPLPLERVVLQPIDTSHAPSLEVAEKLWHGQFPHCARWHLDAPFRRIWHCSLASLVRCEIQAIDQHWSLHRMTLALPGGEFDESLAQGFDFAQADTQPAEPISWPAIDPAAWLPRLRTALEEDLRAELETIRARQERYLRRELERIDDYFRSYAADLEERQGRSQSDTSKARLGERLAAARVEHQRRRQDQVQRHEIRVVPHWDALLLVAEPAWEATVAFVQDHRPARSTAHLVPRARRWFLMQHQA